MKTLIKYAEENDLTIRIVTFRNQGFKVKRKGFDLQRDGRTIYTLEPVSYSNGDKWFIHGSENVSYLKKLSQKELRKL